MVDERIAFPRRSRILGPVEREEIERRDFPSTRRGYDPAAVDEHLRRIADAFARQRPGSLAEGASAQVRAILEAAEAGAEQLRDQAGRDASDHVERVEDAAKAILEKLDRVQEELDRLRTGAQTLARSLEELTRDVGTLGGQEPAPAAPPPAGPRSDDEAGARLVALNMALEGTAREHTARFLAEHYELADVDALLDDVYASAGR